MKGKEMTLAFYRRNFIRRDWAYPLDEVRLAGALQALQAELAALDIRLQVCHDETLTMDVAGYGDLLNSVRIRSPRDGIGNLCLGHVIGASPNRDLLEDIRRGVNRVAFAPETIEPEGSDKIVCHNCGCGC